LTLRSRRSRGPHQWQNEVLNFFKKLRILDSNLAQIVHTIDYIYLMLIGKRYWGEKRPIRILFSIFVNVFSKIGCCSTHIFHKVGSREKTRILGTHKTLFLIEWQPLGHPVGRVKTLYYRSSLGKVALRDESIFCPQHENFESKIALCFIFFLFFSFFFLLFIFFSPAFARPSDISARSNLTVYCLCIFLFPTKLNAQVGDHFLLLFLIFFYFFAAQCPIFSISHPQPPC
jgi:hypothetical protein